jgi:hypothetical protein
MPGKIDIYNLGQIGVDLVESPVHKKDGALISAQNAAHRQEEAEGGLAKRAGMTKLNSTASAGAIYSMFVVRLTDPIPGDID